MPSRLSLSVLPSSSMSLSSPESPTFTSFDSTPSPISSATSVSNEDHTALMDSTTVDPSSAVYDYAQQQHDSYSGTIPWSLVSKKNSSVPHHPLSIHIPSQNSLIHSPAPNVQPPHSILDVDAEEWTRSHSVHCPPLSATTSSSSSLVNVVECGPVKQEYPDYNSVSTKSICGTSCL